LSLFRASPWSSLLLIAVCLAVAVTAADAQPGAEASAARSARSQSFTSAPGDELQVYWNRSLLAGLGIEVAGPDGGLEATTTGFDRFAVLAASRMTARTLGRSVQNVESGMLYVEGGYRFVFDGGQVDLKNFQLRLRPDGSGIFDVVLPNGEVAFYADHAMLEPGAGGDGLHISTMDVRLLPAFADRIGRPSAGDWQVGTLRVWLGGHPSAPVLRQERCSTSTRWPGLPVPNHPGAVYGVDALMQAFAVQVTGCRDCTGPEGGGAAKLSPTTIVRNNVNDGAIAETVPGDPHGSSNVLFAADIPWRSKFSRSCPPYDNDQHPFLTWNLYRIDDDGRIRHLARSGVKHAHVASGIGCVVNPGDNHVFGPGCVDVYGVGDNDSPDLLGPRSEIIPATGVWARCGSDHDPNCRGTDGQRKLYGEFTHRLLVPEAELARGLASGSTFWFEAWYVVRDDVDPYNSMAAAPLDVVWNATTKLWVATTRSGSTIGPVIDRWVAEAHADETSTLAEHRNARGRVRLAVRVTPLDGHRYRYLYALMNVDSADAKTSGRGADIRLQQTSGLTAFRVPLSDAGAFDTPDASSPDAGAAWTAKRSSSAVEWFAPANASMTWGTLMSFELVSNAPPTEGTVEVRDGRGTPTVRRIATLVPAARRD
jgi:hypothetical protein